MKVAGWEILIVELPLRPGSLAGVGGRPTIPSLLVAAHDGEGRTGWGETRPRPGVTGETLESARDALGQLLLPSLRRRPFDGPEAVARTIVNMLEGLPRNQHAAFCAAELALLDLTGQVFGISAGELIGPVRRERVEYGAVIPAAAPEAVAEHAARLAAAGVRQVKLGVGADLEENLARLRAARDALGDDAELRIDARCAWDLAGAVRQLEKMAPFGLAAVEQPLPASDLAGLRELTAAGIVPVVADECLVSLDDARRLVDRRACDVFNVRIAKVGGLLNAARIHRCARAAGLDCQLGASLGESGLLAAAGRHYATRSSEVRWLEGSDTGRQLETQISSPDLTVGRGGRALALTDPGLGVSPVPASLDACTVRRFAVG